MSELVRAAHPQASGLDGAILGINRALTQAGPVFWVAFYGVALILAIALATSLMISSVRDRELSRTEKELESTVRLLTKEFDGHLETFEANPKSVANYLAANSNTPEEFVDLAATSKFHALMKGKVSDATDFAGVNIFDAEGNFLNSSERWPVPPLNLSDRLYFQTFRSQPDSPPLLIQLVDSRLSKGSTIVIARKVSSSNGTFLGVVTRSIPPERFRVIFLSDFRSRYSPNLLHRDGTLLARYPHFDKSFADSLYESPLISEVSTDGSATLQLELAC